MDLRDKKVLVTGASTGIGRSIAAELKRVGANVMICARSEGLLAEAGSQLQVRTRRCDVSDAAEVNGLVGEIRDQWGGLDILVNNAGIQYGLDFRGEVDFAKVRQEIETNLVGPLRLVCSLLPLLRESRQAAIVNVSSGLALVPKRSAPVYCATKAALHSFTVSLRWQLESTNVRVVELLPPLVRTRMTEGRDVKAIDPEAVSSALVDGLRRDAEEVLVGQVKTLKWLSRLLPGIPARILSKE